MSAVEAAKVLATELFEAGEVVVEIYHLPSMLTRGDLDDDLRDLLVESDHPILAFIGDTRAVEDYRVGLDRGAVPIWLVFVEDAGGRVVEGVGDTFEDAVAAARSTLRSES